MLNADMCRHLANVAAFYNDLVAHRSELNIDTWKLNNEFLELLRMLNHRGVYTSVLYGTDLSIESFGVSFNDFVGYFTIFRKGIEHDEAEWILNLKEEDDNDQL